MMAAARHVLTSVNDAITPGGVEPTGRRQAWTRTRDQSRRRDRIDAMRSEPTNAIAEMARRTRNVAETRSVIAAGVEAMVSVAGSGAAVCVPDLGVALGVALG